MAGVFYFPLLGTPTGPGWELSFFEAGLDVPLDVWTDSDLTIPFSQPIVLNAAGNSDGPIYVSPDISYKVVYERPTIGADGTPDYTAMVAVPGYPVDFVAPSTIINVMTTSITTLTNAQIKALPTTPITVVTAPSSSDVRVKVLGATVAMRTTAGAYTNLNAVYSTLQLQTETSALFLTVPITNDNTLATPLTQLSGTLGTTSTFVTDLPVPTFYSVDMGNASGTPGYIFDPAGGTYTAANMGGKAVQIAIDNNGSGNLTGGNAANTLTVTVYYALESLV